MKVISVFFFTVIALSLLSLSSEAKEIKNLVSNPDFEVDTGGWTLSMGNPFFIDKKEKFPVGNVVKAQIDNVGANDWEPEIHSPSFDLEANKMYTVTFWAKTEPGQKRTLGVKFEQLDTWVGPMTTITVDDQWKEYQYSPTITVGSPPKYVVHIQFNRLKEDVWFAHFRVYEGKYVPDDINLGTKPKAVTPDGNLTTSWGTIKIR